MFAADDGVHGKELWRTDGTHAGTMLLKDIRPGAAGSITSFEPVAMYSFRNPPDPSGNIVFFAADDGVHGSELWRTDGTEAGTVLVKDIQPGLLGSSPRSLLVIDFSGGGYSERVVFAAADGVHGEEPWISDGSEAGTILLKDVNPGPAASAPAGFAMEDGLHTLWFAAEEPVSGREPWKSDGTAAGTVLAVDVRPGPASSNPHDFAGYFFGAYYGADDGVHGDELWFETQLVKDIFPGPGSSHPHDLLVHEVQQDLDSRLLVFFGADDGVHGDEPWRSDGTDSGTILLADAEPGAASSSPAEFVAVTAAERGSINPAQTDSGVVFAAATSLAGRELWTTNGTPSGTRLLSDIHPGSEGSAPAGFTKSPRPAKEDCHFYWQRSYWCDTTGQVLFSADDGMHGRELWSVERGYGGAMTVRLARDINSGGDSDPAGVTTVAFDRLSSGSASGFYGVRVFFSAQDGVHGREPFILATPAAAEDLNGDGRSDILWRNVGGPDYGALYVWLMAGTTLTGTYLNPINPDWQVRFVADFNGDGKADILWRNTSNGELYIWMMDGTQVTMGTGFTSDQADTSWDVQAVGDFDGDGRADILWRKLGPGVDQYAMYLWLMNGAQIVGRRYLDPISPDWKVQGTGDFNGDGTDDILWREDGTGATYIWMMDGTQVTTGTGYTNHQADERWQIQGVGDFDGDGRSDILWRNVGGPDYGALYVWLMAGTTGTGSYLDPISPDWQVQGLGDFNADGKSDILWRESSSGATYIWMMDGPQVIAGTGYTDHAADNRWRIEAPSR